MTKKCDFERDLTWVTREMQSNDKCPYKMQAEEGCTNRIIQCGRKAETERTQTQAEECWGPPEAGRGKMILL